MYKYNAILVHSCMFWYILVYNKRLDSQISAWCCPRRARYQRGSKYHNKHLYNLVHHDVQCYTSHGTSLCVLVYTGLQYARGLPNKRVVLPAPRAVSEG